MPIYLGAPNHLHAGDLVTIILYVMNDANWPSGLIQNLPLRQTTISIVTLDNGLPFIRFDGMFGLLADDPFTLWRYLLARQRALRGSIAGIANDSSTTSTYGGFGQFTLQPAADGANKVFHTPNNIGFISGTQVVTVDLLFQRPTYEYVVSNAPAGEITVSIGAALAWVMNCAGNWWVMSNCPDIIAATRLESSGTILMTSLSNFTGPLLLYIDGPHL